MLQGGKGQEAVPGSHVPCRRVQRETSHPPGEEGESRRGDLAQIESLTGVPLELSCGTGYICHFFTSFDLLHGLPHAQDIREAEAQAALSGGSAPVMWASVDSTIVSFFQTCKADVIRLV